MDCTEKSSLMKTVSIPESMDQDISLMDLFDKEPDIIANIFSHMNFRDRLSLAATCTKLNSLHNNLRELWKSVWFDAGRASSETSNLLRKYTNVSSKFSEETAESLKHILTPLAPSMKALKLHYENWKRNPDDYRFIDIIVEILQMVEKHVESLDLRVFYDNLFFNLPVNVKKVIALSNLKYLRISFNMFAATQRHVDFSPSKNLQSIQIHETANLRVASADIVTASLALVELIDQQSALKILEFKGYVLLFDYPVMLKCQLDELEIRERYFGASTEQLEKILDLIDSQEKLKGLRVYVNSHDDLTPRMWRFNARAFDEPHDQKVIIISDSRQEISNEDCILPTTELRRIFRSRHIEPNEITTQVKLQLLTTGNHRHRRQDWLISGLVRKYPNMKMLSIFPEYGPLPNLAPLNNSILLSTLKIRVIRRLGSTLRDVKISGLKVFDLVFDNGLMLNRDFVQMKKFLARHNKLTELRLHLYPADMGNLHEVQRMIENIVDLIHCAIKNLPELTKLKVTSRISMRNHPQLKTMLSSLMSAHDGFTFEFSERLRVDTLKVVRT